MSGLETIGLILLILFALALPALGQSVEQRIEDDTDGKPVKNRNSKL